MVRSIVNLQQNHFSNSSITMNPFRNIHNTNGRAVQKITKVRDNVDRMDQTNDGMASQDKTGASHSPPVSVDAIEINKGTDRVSKDGRKVAETSQVIGEGGRDPQAHKGKPISPKIKGDISKPLKASSNVTETSRDKLKTNGTTEKTIEQPPKGPRLGRRNGRQGGGNPNNVQHKFPLRTRPPYAMIQCRWTYLPLGNNVSNCTFHRNCKYGHEQDRYYDDPYKNQHYVDGFNVDFAGKPNARQEKIRSDRGERSCEGLHPRNPKQEPLSRHIQTMPSGPPISKSTSNPRESTNEKPAPETSNRLAEASQSRRLPESSGPCPGVSNNQMPPVQTFIPMASTAESLMAQQNQYGLPSSISMQVTYLTFSSLNFEGQWRIFLTTGLQRHYQPVSVVDPMMYTNALMAHSPMRDVGYIHQPSFNAAFTPAAPVVTNLQYPEAAQSGAFPSQYLREVQTVPFDPVLWARVAAGPPSRPAAGSDQNHTQHGNNRPAGNH
ncbi:hypothetical protein RUND412_005412 [Rhizina undulata]